MRSSMVLIALFFVAAFVPAFFSAPLERRDTISAGIKIEAQGSSSGLRNSASFSARGSTFLTISFLGYQSLWYNSFSVSGNANNQSATVDASGIAGYVYVYEPIIGDVGATAPAAWMAYFSAKADAQKTNSGVNVNVEGSAGYVATYYWKLEESDAAGALVRTVSLKSLEWKLSEIKDIDTTETKAAIQYATFTGTKDDVGKVTITFAVSKVVAKINVGGAILTPKSMEAIVEIEGYKYANAANSISLVMIVGTVAASGKASFAVEGLMRTGSGGADELYLKFDKQATVDGGVSAAVTITHTATAASNIEDAAIKGAVDGKASAVVEVVSVKFPAGKALISYDPGMGFGVPDSAAKVIPTFVTLFVALFVYYFGRF